MVPSAMRAQMVNAVAAAKTTTPTTISQWMSTVIGRQNRAGTSRETIT